MIGKGVLLCIGLMMVSLAPAEVQRSQEAVLTESDKRSLASYAKRMGTPAGVSTTDSVFLSIVTNGAKVEILGIAPPSFDRETMARAIDQWATRQGIPGQTVWDEEAVRFLHNGKRFGALRTQKSLDLEALRQSLGADSQTAIARFTIHRAADHSVSRFPDFAARNVVAWRLPRGKKWDSFEVGFTLPIYIVPLLAYALSWLLLGPLLILAVGLLKDRMSTDTLSNRADRLNRLLKALPVWSIGLHAPVVALLLFENTLPRVLFLWLDGSLSSVAYPLLIGGVISTMYAVGVLNRKADALREQIPDDPDRIEANLSLFGIWNFEVRRNPQPWRNRLGHLSTLVAALLLGTLGTGGNERLVFLAIGAVGLLFLFFFPGRVYHWNVGFEVAAQLELAMQEWVDQEAGKHGVDAPEAKLETKVEWTARYAELITNPQTAKPEFRFGLVSRRPLSDGEKRFLAHREFCQSKEVIWSRRGKVGGYLWLLPALAIPGCLYLLSVTFPAFQYPLGGLLLVTMLTLSIVPKLQQYIKQQAVVQADRVAFESFDSPEDARAFFENGLAEERKKDGLTPPSHALFAPRVAALKKAGLL